MIKISDKIESVLVFFTGGPLAGGVSFALFHDVGLPIILAIITGFLGGAAAILGKIFINWMLKKKSNK